MTSVDLIRRWVDLFNQGDAAACGELYADDATLHLAFAPGVEGRGAIRGMFEAYFAAAPLHCIVRQLYAGDGGRVVLEWEDRVGLLGVNIYEIEEGRIRRQRNYFDQLSFMRLNGLPMPAA